MTVLVVPNLVGGTTLALCAEFPNMSKVVSFGYRDVGRFDIFPISKSSMFVSVVGVCSSRLRLWTFKNKMVASAAIAGSRGCSRLHTVN